LLSQVLVAFTIECDNEFERQMPHRTSNYGSTAGRGVGPWLVSMAMWWTCMRLVGADGITVAELTRRARPGMLRWKYIRVESDPADSRPKPPRSDWVIPATRAGRQAQEVWRPLTIRAVREALEQLTTDQARLDTGLEPPPGGWRASLRRPAMLPHYPMVLHRGGFPDGS
jgi:hypothetical protein